MAFKITRFPPLSHHVSLIHLVLPIQTLSTVELSSNQIREKEAYNLGLVVNIEKDNVENENVEEKIGKRRKGK